jgi:DNA-binding transcriptional regulator YhcF (GntR family)
MHGEWEGSMRSWFSKQSTGGLFRGKYDFSDRVRKVLALAREEAIRLRHEYVGTEHLLLGLTRETKGGAAEVLKRMSIDTSEVRRLVETLVRRGAATIAVGELPYTSRAKKVLEYTMVEARELRLSPVDTEHLLLGLLREDKGIAAEVLTRLGVTLEAVREEILRLRSESDTPADGRGGGERTQFRVAIDDGSEVSIYEQIIAQVQEGVATGRLATGDRLLPVRQLADELQIAPGTVARAYGELERMGIVATEGSRGTRIAEGAREPLPEAERPEMLRGLLRPLVVAAFHLGATADELREALERSMVGIFLRPEEGERGDAEA